MSKPIEMTREQKQYLTEAMLNGKKFDRYLIGLGIIHAIDDPFCMEMVDGKFFYFDTEIDLEKVETHIRIGLPGHPEENKELSTERDL
jgi:hypothetical protein